MKFWVAILGLVLVSPVVMARSMSNALAMDEEVPIIMREPASEPAYYANQDASARIDHILDDKTIKATTSFNDWRVGETVAVESQKSGVGIIGFLEIIGVSNNEDGTYQVTAELLRQSRLHFIQLGDQIYHINLSSENNRYKGTTDLIVKRRGKNISAKYKPLFTQGVSVGETAETLWENEYVISWYGQINYGITDKLSVGTIIPGDIAGAYNGSGKYRVFSSDSNTFSVGANTAHVPKDGSNTLNFTVYWDSISSESVISHTMFTVAAMSFADAADVTAVKTLGTTSFQTGYEFIGDNWDRVLLGPSYNFETKALGGYLTYVKIWDRFHFSLSLNSTDVSSFKLSATDGYYVLFDAYWRF
ncbi:hypothetical protein ACLSU7_00095 [Bdellovibrio sp. HCB185ZH]|uniref:hypothetical protein n=1 Tax=Bdellovibrio sp. HCB185ZH TaxID=3394235 RepID=UPI0039A57BC8